MSPVRLDAAVRGERRTFTSTAGLLSYYHTGPAAAAGLPALLLVHSINAAGSAREVEPIFEHYRHDRHVFALDLPGFGQSERSDRIYAPRLMADALHAMLDEIEGRAGRGAVDALAVSLSCEFLARVAVESPRRLGRIALVSPTGFNGTKRRYGPPGSTLALPWLHRLLAWPGWSRGLYRNLTRPSVIRFFLEKTWGSKQIDEGLLAYDIALAAQPGAHHAPLHFLSAGLFSADINRLYEALELPVWMAHGTRGDFVDYRGKSTVEGRANWRIDVFEAGAMPYFEQPAAFAERFDAFLTAHPPPPVAPTAFAG